MKKEAIHALVEKLLGKQFDSDLKNQLNQLGKTALPALLAALADRRFQTHRYKKSDSLSDKSALEVILDLLNPFAPVEAIPVLTRLVKARGEDLKYVALALGNIGHLDCLEPVARLLKNKDEYVVSYAMRGVQNALAAGRTTPKFKKAMFDLLEPVLSHATYFVYQEAADLMLALNSNKAMGILVSEEHWRLDNADRLRFFLEVLVEASARVPHRKLLALEKELRPYVGESAETIYKFRFGRAGGHLMDAYESVLLLMAQRKTPGTAKIILQARQAHPELAAKAAEALTILDEIPDPFHFLQARVKRVGIQGLTEPQKLIHCVYGLYWSDWYNYFIRDYCSEDGEPMDAPPEAIAELEMMEEYALKGLKVIGAHDAAGYFQQAREGGGWTELEKQFRAAEDIQALVLDFVRSHPSEFRPRRRKK